MFTKLFVYEVEYTLPPNRSIFLPHSQNVIFSLSHRFFESFLSLVATDSLSLLFSSPFSPLSPHPPLHFYLSYPLFYYLSVRISFTVGYWKITTQSQLCSIDKGLSYTFNNGIISSAHTDTCKSNLFCGCFSPKYLFEMKEEEEKESVKTLTMTCSLHTCLEGR